MISDLALMLSSGAKMEFLTRMIPGTKAVGSVWCRYSAVLGRSQWCSWGSSKLPEGDHWNFRL